MSMRTKEEKRLYDKQWKEKNKDKVRAYAKEYNKKYYKNKKNDLDKINNEWAKNNPERIKEIRTKYKRSPKAKYSAKKTDANKRKIPFNLSLEFFINWYNKQPITCHYCDILYSEDCYDTVRTVDRIDNNIGYEPNNIVMCCMVCNRTKNKYFSYNEMLVLGKTIKEIYKKRKNANNSL